MRGVRVTAIQAAHAAIRAELEAYEALLSLEEYAVLTDLLWRVVDLEKRRVSRWERSKQP